ncbi:MAG: MotA/TolQ/ExbB proton channel family protein [Bacteriovoracia bacterium]
MDFLEFLKNPQNIMHVAPLLVVGAFAIAIVVERIRSVFFTYPMRNSEGFFERITELTLSGKTGDAVQLCDKHLHTPLAKVTKAALVRAHLPEGMIEHGIEYSVGEACHAIQKRTSFLATIANVATLLGLFGTIAGLIHSFKAIEFADAQNRAKLLSAGIATAMNATMLGLAIAIPCMIAYSFIMNRSNRLIGELENSSVRLMEILKQRYYAVTTGDLEEAGWDDHMGKGNGHAKGKAVGRAA